MPSAAGANARRAGNLKFLAPKSTKPKPVQRPPPPPREKMTEAQVERLRELFREQFGGKEPRSFQIDAIRAQQDGRDVLVHVATGMGKTAVAAGPFLLEENADKVMLLVSPLVGLQEEMVDTFNDEFKIKAVALNSSHETTDQQLRDVIDGHYRIVLLSPEMLLSRRFLDRVLRNRIFSNKVYSVVVDEAHCISHWGADFRKKYAQIGSIRVFLSRNTPFVALSASLTQRVTRDVVEKLQLNRDSYLYIDLGNDRPNVSLVARAIQNPINSYTDLDFVIPPSPTSINDIPKSFIYADSIPTGTAIVNHLRTLLPDITMHGTIRPYNAVHSTKYRKKVMRRFKKGKVRILVCTDAAGMGCNVPDIDLVVQWKLPKKLSSFVQRAGRAARGAGRTGLGVLLVEPLAYSRSILQEAIAEAKKAKGRKRRKKGGGGGEGGGEKKKAKKKQDTWSADHGRFRGGRGGGKDDFPPSKEAFPPLNHAHESEGMYHFVQTRQCRRAVFADVFNNPPPNPTVPCCDVCDPSLLDRTRPGIRPKRGGEGRVTYAKESSKSVWIYLDDWREGIFDRDFGWSSMTPETVLPTQIVDKIARLELPLQEQHVRKILSSEWVRWSRYGEEVVALLRAATIAPNPPSSTELDAVRSAANPTPAPAPSVDTHVSPAARTSAKRPATGGVTDTPPSQDASATPAKRRRTAGGASQVNMMEEHRASALDQPIQYNVEIPVTPARVGHAAGFQAPSSQAPAAPPPALIPTAHVQPMPYTPHTQFGPPSYGQHSPYGRPLYAQTVAYSPHTYPQHATYVQAAYEHQAAEAQAAYARQVAYAQQVVYAQQAAYAQRAAHAQAAPSPRTQPTSGPPGSSTSSSVPPPGSLAQPFLMPLLPEYEGDRLSSYPPSTSPP
ncbi:unnamed protein product [Peniophora sp. CBMAI 1063]|nr:unnamed protein product [Peniophora sp. CBMAI 1063]